MGELYAFDRDGERLHPGDRESGGVTDVTDRDNVVLGLGVHSHGAALQCIVNGVETTVDRVQAILRYETTATTGVFREFVEAVETDLVRGRGWRIDTVENEGNPGYVFQRLRNAAAGENPQPDHLPPDHGAVESLLADGETVTIHVRDYSVAGDVILRYGDVGCNVTVAETRALGTQPEGLVIVQDDTIDRATWIPEESRERIRTHRISTAAERIDEGATALANLGVPDDRVAEVFDERAAGHFDDLEVMGPEDVEKVSELYEEVQTLREENQRLRERTEKLEKAARSADRTPRESSDQETRADGHGGTQAPSQETDDDSGGSVFEDSLVEFAVLVAVLLGIVLISVL